MALKLQLSPRLLCNNTAHFPIQSEIDLFELPYVTCETDVFELLTVSREIDLFRLSVVYREIYLFKLPDFYRLGTGYR